MSGAFVKLYASILDSTVWLEPPATRLVWITLLAMGDAEGVVEASIPGLARRAGVSLEETETALARFLAPDPYSRTAEHEGRRIEVVPGGWLLLNARLYRERRTSSADRMAAKRERERANASASHRVTVTVEGEGEGEAYRERERKGSHVAQPTHGERAPSPAHAVEPSPPSIPCTTPPGNPPELASLPLRLMADVDPDAKGWRRKQADRLWAWHETERIARLQGGRGTARNALPEHVDMVLRLVAKVGKQEGIDERAAFLRVKAFRVAAIEQAVRKAADDPEYGRKLVTWARNDSAWSIKAYDAVMSEHVEAIAVASVRGATPPGTVDGDLVTPEEIVAWRDVLTTTGDPALARMAIVSRRKAGAA